MISLRLFYGRDHEDMIRRLQKAKDEEIFVSTLEVRATFLDEAVIEAITDLLLAKQVETVQLDDCGAYLNKQAIRMARALGNVKNLRLSEPTFLCQFFLDCLLMSATKLANLRIQDHLSVDQIGALSKGLKENVGLRVLDLSRSRLDDVSILASGLCENKNLNCLKLRSVSLNDQNIGDIVESLKNHPTLTSLDLSFNHFRNLDHVSDLVRSTTCIRELFLGYQNVWQAPKLDVTQLTRALKINSSLTKLSLARNKLNDGDAEVLASALLENTTLQDLDLRENKITDCGITSLTLAVSLNTAIKRLNVANNPFAEQGTEALLATVMKNFNIVHIELNDCSNTAWQIRYYASLNKGGRRLFVENPSISVWPLALEKVNNIDWLRESSGSFKISAGSEKLDVLYYLLRGPALFDGRGFN